jgi:AraC family transcriptional regulator
MILKGYPDTTKPGFNKDAPCPVHVWPNMIIHNKTKLAHYPEHTGPLTIKCPLKGKETFSTPERNFIVDDRHYLILNDGQTYSCEINSEVEVEVISVFFRPQFAEQVLGSLVNSSDKLLEINTPESAQPVFFMEKLYKQDKLVTPAIMKFRLASENNFDDEQWIEEELYLLLTNMLKVHRKVSETIEKLPSVKRSTKLEIYRRLDLSKEFIENNIGNDINIEDMAKVACLSTYHFIRLFKSVYDMTPHKYLSSRRLEKSMTLLLRGNLSITDVCFEVGFKSLSSFSWLFKQRYGLYPEETKNSYQYMLTKLAILKK